MRLGKSTGPSSKSVKLLGHLKTIELIRSLNKTYDSGQIPPNIPKSIFMALPKETGGAAECELHIMNSFMSHITTILLRMIMM